MCNRHVFQIEQDDMIEWFESAQIVPKKHGCRPLFAKLRQLYYLDDQDPAGTRLDKLLSLQRSREMDASSYPQEFVRFLDEAEVQGGLDIGPITKTWLFFSRSGIPDRMLSDFRFKVDGDLNRFEEILERT